MSGKRKEIKRRMKSVANTKKMTKAMEMTAAAKMRKAQQIMLSSRFFSDKSWEIFSNLSESLTKISHPLMQEKPTISRICIIHMTSDKGLCGSLNAQANKKVWNFIQEQRDLGITEISVISIGKKGSQFLNRLNIESEIIYPNWQPISLIEHLLPLLSELQNRFLNNTYKAVYISSTEFNSTLSQTPTIKQILPFVIKDTKFTETKEEKKQTTNYTFEPTAKEVLNQLIPRLVESTFYQALLEFQASEHSARMVAMKNATESASELIDELKLKFNKARQASITQEIIEIMSAQSAIK